MPNTATGIPTQRDALADLMRWIQETGTKPSLLVSSGAGLRVYFRLTADASPLEWLPPAIKGLKGMALATGLRIDATVTADIVPGSCVRPARCTRTALACACSTKPPSTDWRTWRHVANPTCPSRRRQSSLNASIIGTVQGHRGQPPRWRRTALRSATPSRCGDVPGRTGVQCSGSSSSPRTAPSWRTKPAGGHPSTTSTTRRPSWTAGPPAPPAATRSRV